VFDAHVFDKFTNTVYYSESTLVKRIDIDAMRRKKKMQTIIKNLSYASAEDMRSLFDYEPSTDDIKFYVDENEGFKRTPTQMDRGHVDRKTLKMKRFEDLYFIVTVLSALPKNKETSDSTENEATGIMQIIDICSM
jgi:hypothetical protein